MAEPSKVMPSSRAFSSSAGVMVKVFGRPEDVGEPELDEADAPLLDRPQHVLLLAPHAASDVLDGRRRSPAATGSSQRRRPRSVGDGHAPFTVGHGATAHVAAAAPTRAVAATSRLTASRSRLVRAG